MKGSKALHRKDFLGLLAQSKNAKRRRLLAEWADKNDLLAVSECIGNVLMGNVKLTPQQIKRLRRHKRSLRILAKKTGSLTEKWRMIAQHGGFLPFLIPTILKAIAGPLLGSLLGAATGRR